MAKILRWIVTLSIPFMLAGFIIDLVIDPWYPIWEYGKASFPEDSFGWTNEQRLELAQVAVDFLNAEGSAEDTIFMLGDQINPQTGEPLYTANELSHMVDVKVRTDLIKRGSWVLAVIVVASLTLLLYKAETADDAYRAFRNGGIATFVILIVFAVMIGVFWSWFFTTFHEVLFPAGNWQFLWSDSLIRLFPDKFWFDAGTVIVGGTLVCGAIIALIGHRLVRGSGLKR